MKDLTIYLVILGLSFAVWAFLNFWLIRAGVRAALNNAVVKINETNQLLLTQTAHLHELVKRKNAQLDLMLITARSHGLSEEELLPVTSQISKAPIRS